MKNSSIDTSYNMLYTEFVSKYNLPSVYRSTPSASFFMPTKQNIKTIEEKKSIVPTSGNILEIIGTLTISQIKFLCKFLELPEHSGFSQSQSEGRIAASLHQRGLICPRGRNGDHIRWVMTDYFHPDARRLLKQIGGWEEKI